MEIRVKPNATKDYMEAQGTPGPSGNCFVCGVHFFPMREKMVAEVGWNEEAIGLLCAGCQRRTEPELQATMRTHADRCEEDALLLRKQAQHASADRRAACLAAAEDQQDYADFLRQVSQEPIAILRTEKIELPKCSALCADGSPCGKTGVYMGARRGELFCDEHRPGREQSLLTPEEEALAHRNLVRLLEARSAGDTEELKRVWRDLFPHADGDRQPPDRPRPRLKIRWKRKNYRPRT